MAPASSTGSGPATREPSPTRVATPPPPAPKLEEPEGGDGLKDDWDASSEEEPAKPAADVKDAWDDSSDDEAPKSSGMSIQMKAIRIPLILRESQLTVDPLKEQLHHRRRPPSLRSKLLNLLRQKGSLLRLSPPRPPSQRSRNQNPTLILRKIRIRIQRTNHQTMTG